jgi:hypothetical protein
MTDIHSCSYHCDRLECIKAQRDELRERLAQPEQKPVPWESFFKRYCPWLAQPEQEPTAKRAWFTIAELNALADKKLSENPHWVMPKDKPERDEPPPQRKPEQEPIKESSITHGHLWIGDLYGKEKNNG